MKNTYKAKKKYGQNFLVSKKISTQIIELINLSKKNIIEIGPGNLALTEIILSKKPKKFIALEIDKEIVEAIKGSNKSICHYILNENALSFNETNFFKNESFLIISNLPFNISNKLLIKWIKLQHKIKCISGMILMFQKELGERIIANKNEKKYGRISILAQSLFDVQKKIIVSKKNFYPQPKVDAMVIKFTPIQKNEKINLEKLEKITNIFFNSRRKKNEKKIKSIFNSEQIINNNFEELFELRAENIPKEIFYKMANLL